MKTTYHEEAREILEHTKGTPLSIQERTPLAIKLSGLMLNESIRLTTYKERAVQNQLAQLMEDPKGKIFTSAMTDQCFRSDSNKRSADQMIYLLNQLGIPQYLNWIKRAQLFVFKSLGPKIARFLIPIATYSIRKETSKVILPGELSLLTKHLIERQDQGIQLNLNHIGEAILSEAEAKNRLQIYLDDLGNPNINYMSVKISTLFSQINLLASKQTIDSIADRLRQLYRAAIKNPIDLPNGKKKPKFINLDMEEYRDLSLTVEAFKKVLEEAEFQDHPAGIVLQAYLPDSHPIQKELTEWAKLRIQNGGAPIKIRIVKGANLAMEQFEASLKGWAQAPYTSKLEVDANYKRMVIYGCIKENARAVRLGVASHNLFDIAFAMLLRVENEVESYVGFEMLEGMAEPVRRAVQKLTGDMLLYCPVATKEEFQHAIAYLIRRLDENTGPENFLRHIFELKPGTESWDQQAALFSQSCDQIETVELTPRRTQSRLVPQTKPEVDIPFDNEADTDFSLIANQHWAEEIASHAKKMKIQPIPLVINGQETLEGSTGEGFNPSDPEKILFQYTKALPDQIEEALSCAKKQEKLWGSTSIEHRSHLLANVAQKLRERRGELLGAMIVDGGKTILESDPEISEAIDFAEYYRRQMEKMSSMQDISWKPKGTVLVASPWNFPCAIPVGGITAALAAGNCVLFKPASDTVFIAWLLINAMWDAGIPKEVLQFIPCSGEDSGSLLIRDPRVNCVILTGGTETAKNFLKIRPGLDLAAETGGKNAIIVTALADRDLAIKDIIQSAFGHSGQKCSACSLVILEAEVYDNPNFRSNLREAAASLKVGPAWDLTTKINPLIHPPKGALKRGLTTLEPGEEWLLEPKCHEENPSLWSPGIKLGIRPGSFTHMTELFGPVLAVMRADDLNHAIELANQVSFGLTSGLQSLDEREQLLWTKKIVAGNLYVNRSITGAIVRRQPFGGTKASNFGNGSKAGGPNYLREFMHASQINLPKEKHPVNEWVNSLTSFLEKIDLTAEQLGLWTSSVANYSYWWKRLSQDRDPSKVVGQDNLFRYVPRSQIVLRLTPESSPLDVLRVCAAALTCEAEMEISCFNEPKVSALNWVELLPIIHVIKEDHQTFLNRVSEGGMNRIRLLEPASKDLQIAAAKSATHIIDVPVLANGRLELLHYLREIALSIDYHRYGNLGMREGELRKPIL